MEVMLNSVTIKSIPFVLAPGVGIYEDTLHASGKVSLRATELGVLADTNGHQALIPWSNIRSCIAVDAHPVSAWSTKRGPGRPKA